MQIPRKVTTLPAFCQQDVVPADQNSGSCPPEGSGRSDVNDEVQGLMVMRFKRFRGV